MEMKIKYNLNGDKRSLVASEIGKVVGATPKYLGCPSLQYQIGGFRLDKTGTLIIDSETDEQLVERVMECMEDKGYILIEEPAEDGAYQGVTISMPKETLTDEELGNLRKIVWSKSNLMKKAFGTDQLDIVETKDAINFPWFPEYNDSDETLAAAIFVTKICDMAKTQKRIMAQLRESDNEKYTFRCFLLRLGFIGDEYKVARKILLRNLPGNSAFKNK